MATWQRKEFKNPDGGLNAKWVAQFKKENPGSKLKIGVDKTPKTPDEIRRQGQFLTRFYGRKDLPPLVDEKWRPTRLALAASAWNSKVPKTESEARKLAAKWRALLERYKKLKTK